MKAFITAALIAAAVSVPQAASAITHYPPAASADLAKALGAEFVTFEVRNNKVAWETWHLGAKGWTKAQIEAAVRRIALTDKPFLGTRTDHGGVFITPLLGLTAVYDGAAPIKSFSVYSDTYAYDPSMDKMMFYMPGVGVRAQAATPENLKLLKPGMHVDRVVDILGFWTTPVGEHNHGPNVVATWNKNGKPAYRVTFKDHAVAKVQTL
ncbi:MAG: hypothetical protein ACK46X_07125 [Candidatus Sericytochromatia bacterium]